MSSSFGEMIRISIFGESHGEAIGVVLDNLPAGCPIDEVQLALQMARRAPGRDTTSTYIVRTIVANRSGVIRMTRARQYPQTLVV